MSTVNDLWRDAVDTILVISSAIGTVVRIRSGVETVRRDKHM